MTEMKTQKSDTIDIVLFATYFFIPFYGLRIALENYLMEDDLDIGYLLMIGLVSGITSTIYMTVLKSKKTKAKIFGLGILLIFVITVNLIVN